MSAAKAATRLELTLLEGRDSMSVSSVALVGGVLTVRTDAAATSVQVVPSGENVVLKDLSTGRAWSYTAGRVSDVDFTGGAGNDRFVNDVVSVRAKASGQGGDDYLEGSNGADVFSGGDGNDTLVGYGGNDQMWGGAGNDVLRGMDGNDALAGDDGNDQLNGGAGADSLWGGTGNDILIAIDGGASDLAQGDAGSDVVWADNGSSWDTVYAVDVGDRVQWVSYFNNGADRTLDGNAIVDPTASGRAYKRFAGRPLFGDAGPLYTDVRQGQEGDCWLLSGLSAIALDSPNTLRQNVVDFGDGTYGVRLGNAFYRVDADLPVSYSTATNPAFAQFGSGGSIWVAVVEKAYAHYRTGANSYTSLSNGWSVDVNRAFGATSTGDYAIGSYTSPTALANALYSAWANHGAVTIGFLGIAPGAPLVNVHMYTVVSFTCNSAGQITHVTLRNPWGYDGAGSDSNPNDGLVTVSINTLYLCAGRVNWGRV